MAAGFVRSFGLAASCEADGYPFSLPVVAGLREIGAVELAAGATFFVGENGTGKSTLVEALAVALGFNAEGGSQNFGFATRSSHSPLGEQLTIRRGIAKPRTGYFLRAESYYNVATEIERLDQDPYSPPLLPAYGGVSPHERSHGESFLDLAVHRFGPEGLYLLDEPEAALSVRGCMALLARLSELVRQGSQFIVSTHSPILLALPDALIVEIDEDGHFEHTDYDDALPVRLTRGFLAQPQRYLRHLLHDDAGGMDVRYGSESP